MWDRKVERRSELFEFVIVLSELCGIESNDGEEHFCSPFFVLSELCGIERWKIYFHLTIRTKVLSELCGIERSTLQPIKFLRIRFCLNYVG